MKLEGFMKEKNMHTEKLFSYGTLRYEAVQLSTFNRKLEGTPDSVIGYRLSNVQITDPDVLAISGEAVHPMLTYTGNFDDKVAGMVFEISAQELQLADQYEVADYKRVNAALQSGLEAWVYVDVNAA
jgi:gamma-glutamylcyclotransferase (GGCT)/AIG2-like uncharacterized protein YtfP